MNNTVHIRTFEDLCEAIMDPRLTKENINEILCTTIGSICIFDDEPEEIVKVLRAFWDKWGKEPERPLFIDKIDLNVIESGNE